VGFSRDATSPEAPTVAFGPVTVVAVGRRFRGWLALAVAVLLSGALLGLAHWPASHPIGTSDGSLAEGRPPVSVESTSDPSGQAVAYESVVEDLLARRADAVLQRSEAEFMATVDPQADPAFVDAQRVLFHNLDGVPLSYWSYVLDKSESLPVPQSLLGTADYWAPRTTLRYALQGVDAEPTSRPMAYLYVRRAGQWFLASDTALEPQGETTWRGMWDFGPCHAFITGNSLVLGHTGAGDETLRQLAADTNGAVDAVTQVWGTSWSQRVAVLVPKTVEEMRALVGPTFNVDGIAAVAVADKVDVTNQLALGQRVVLNPALAGRLSAPARRIVLGHEVTHVAARASTVDGAPMWLLEGFADYVGYRDSGLQPPEAASELARALRTGDPPTRLPVAADFAGGSDNLDLAYQLAWSAALYVVDLAGEDGLVDLYRMIASDLSQDEATVQDAMRAVLGVDLDSFVAGWLESLPPRFG
jgi:hypothetical protein